MRSLNDATAGVVYQIHGRNYWPQITVALYTLRKHYAGPVCLMALDDAGRDIARRLADVPALQPVQVVSPSTIRCVARNSGYAAKSRIIPACPYTHGVFLDADTVVAGPWDRLDTLVPQNNEQVVLTQFSNWYSSGNRVSKRCLKWLYVAPHEANLCADRPYPAINTGVFGFVRESSYFQRDWEEMTSRNVSFICDEIAAQLLLPRLLMQDGVRVLPDTHNCSPIYGVNKADAVIWHFHGGKHLREAAGQLWWHPFVECCKLNIAGIADWAGLIDHRLHRIPE